MGHIMSCIYLLVFFFFFQAEDGIRDDLVTGVQTCALPICVVFHSGDQQAESLLALAQFTRALGDEFVEIFVQLTDSGFVAFALRDIARDAEEAGERAMVIAQAGRREQHRNARLVLANISPLPRLGSTLKNPGDKNSEARFYFPPQFATEFLGARDYLRRVVKDAGSLPAHQFRRSIAEQLLSAGIKTGDDAFHRRGEDCGSSAFEQRLLENGFA